MLPSRKPKSNYFVPAYTIGLLTLVFTIAGCSSSGPITMDLMNSPGIYSEVGIDPFDDNARIGERTELTVLYATNRAPVEEGSKSKERFYDNNRGSYLYLGEAKVKVGDDKTTWSDLKEYSLLKNSTKRFPLQVKEVHEFGILPTSYSRLEKRLSPEDDERPGKEFAAAINAQLKDSKLKDVVIYIHGFKVNFDNPIIVTSELSHFHGNQGAFIAFAWPSTPKKNIAYFKDVETANHSARQLRLLIEYLHANTDAEHINIIAYSMGTRIAIKTLHDLRLKYDYIEGEALRDASRIGQVFLVGSDFDRDIFGDYFEDGITDLQDQMNIYMSEKDSALGMARFVFGYNRLGQTASMNLDGNAVRYLEKQKDLVLIDVTSAEGATKGNGHAYFRQSPWVSSDIIITMYFKATPEKRKLIQNEQGIWSFRPEYIQDIKDAKEE